MRRVNLLRAHGSPSRYYYLKGCRCVACRAANAESCRHYYETHREEALEYQFRRRAEHPEYQRHYRAEHREEALEYGRRRRADHPEYSREYYEANREAYAEYSREYRADAEHAEEARERHRNRRALEANATGTHSAADVKAQHERQSGKCFWRNVNPACAVSLKCGYHVDHVTPLVKKGSNGTENIVLACPSCNLTKHAKDPMDWAGVMF